MVNMLHKNNATFINIQKYNTHWGIIYEICVGIASWNIWKWPLPLLGQPTSLSQSTQPVRVKSQAVPSQVFTEMWQVFSIHMHLTSCVGIYRTRQKRLKLYLHYPFKLYYMELNIINIQPTSKFQTICAASRPNLHCNFELYIAQSGIEIYLTCKRRYKRSFLSRCWRHQWCRWSSRSRRWLKIGQMQNWNSV